MRNDTFPRTCDSGGVDSGGEISKRGKNISGVGSHCQRSSGMKTRERYATKKKKSAEELRQCLISGTIRLNIYGVERAAIKVSARLYKNEKATNGERTCFKSQHEVEHWYRVQSGAYFH